MKVLGIIPARYASTRLEGKPLKDIGGKSMIQRVYEQANKAFKSIVATDDTRIAEHVENFGGEAIMTSKDHNTGTNRCLEAYWAFKHQTDENYDVIVNIQGDEPLIDPKQLLQLLSCFGQPDTQIATLVKKVSEPSDLENENRVFVTFTKNSNALYFSRSVIPAVRGIAKSDWLSHAEFYRHIGLYAYTPKALASFAGMTTTSLETAESLEQNRWLQNDGEIKVFVTEMESLSVDTADDLEKVRAEVKRLEA